MTTLNALSVAWVANAAVGPAGNRGAAANGPCPVTAGGYGAGNR